MAVTEEGLRLALSADISKFSKPLAEAKGVAVDLNGTLNGLGKAVYNSARPFEALGKSVQGASGKFVLFNKDMLGSSNVMRGFISQAKLGELSYVRMGQASANAGKAIRGLSDSVVTSSGKIANANGTISAFNNIIRDAPYGIIGVGNNITQLSDSFSLLISQTGSVGGAIKSMVSSIFSPGGIFTIGLSLATSLWTTYAQSQQRAQSEAKKAAKEIKTLSEIYKDISASTQQFVISAKAEATLLGKLFEAAKDDTRSKRDRLSALNALKNATNGYLKDLTLETVHTDSARKSLDQFNASLINSALLKANQSYIDDLAKSYGQLERDSNAGRKEIERLQKLQLDRKQLSGEPLSNDVVKRFNQAIAVEKEIYRVTEETNTKIKEQNRLYDNIANSTSKLAELQIKTNPFTGEANKSTKEVRTIVDVLNDLDKELRNIANQSSLLGLSFDKLAEDNVTALYKAFEDISKIGGPAASVTLQKLQKQIQHEQNKIVGDIKVKEIQLIDFKKGGAGKIGDMSGVFRDLTPAIFGATQAQAAFNMQVRALQSTAANGEYTKMQNALQTFRTTAGEAVEGIKESLIGGLAEGVAGLATGATTFGGLLGSLLSMIGDFAINLGKSAIGIGITAKAVRSAFATPGGAILAGAGLVALGALIKGFAGNLSKPPAFATGGKVDGETLALLGDNPSGVEYIIPKEVIDRLKGDGGTMRGRLTARVSARDLEFVLENDNNRNN